MEFQTYIRSKIAQKFVMASTSISESSEDDIIHNEFELIILKNKYVNKISLDENYTSSHVKNISRWSKWA